MAGGPLLGRLRAIADHVIARELPVLLAPDDAAGAPVGFVSGTIDLVYRDPETGELVIADYKTDEVAGGRELRERAVAYAAQGVVYRRALREALGSRRGPRVSNSGSCISALSCAVPSSCRRLTSGRPGGNSSGVSGARRRPGVARCARQGRAWREGVSRSKSARRTATTAVADARALFKEYASALGRHLSFEEFARELTDLPGEYAPPSGALLLANCEGRLAGCVALRPLGEGVCEMRRLYVRHHFRGKGVGRRLSLAVIDGARERGYRAMRVELRAVDGRGDRDLPCAGVPGHRAVPAGAGQRRGFHGASAALIASSCARRAEERRTVRRFTRSKVRRFKNSKGKGKAAIPWLSAFPLTFTV